MDEKINLKAITQYSHEFAERLLNSYFDTRDVITGPEILRISELRQINLFIIYELFKTWKDENKRNRSPFFDYSDPEVREAQELLMNSLSNHISVNRENFSPLLRKAAYNTLLLIIDPYDFFADLIEGQHDHLLLETFKEQLRYVKINRAPLERLVQKLEEKNVLSISGNEAFALLDTILEEVNFTPEDIDEYISKFSSVVPVTIDRFYDVRQAADQSSEEHSNKEDSYSHWQPPTKTTVNEGLAQEPRAILADNFRRISSIRETLSINQKFMFTKVLFHGDFELFSKAIDDLDRQDHLKGALTYLEQNYEEWDRESEEFHEFMELLEKRFGTV
jgi:hypothetical protein